MSLAAGWPTARPGWFDGFDRGSDNATGGVAAWDPVPDKFPAGVLGADAKVLKACSAQHRFQFFDAGGSGHAAAERGKVGGDFGRKFRGAHYIGNGDSSARL